jgi:osmoprotectant transport system ATP-binding protein
MSLISVEHVVKTYDNDIKVLNDVSFSVEKGEFVVLLGPSGCGKTTLLKMINGLIEFDQGNIKVLDKNIKSWDIIKLRRSIGYVIQNIGLFPHLNILDNITYVLSLEKIPKSIKIARAKELIMMVGLSEDLLYRYPHELSGGQRQRIGVARALASDPEIILMDEPFGAIDEIARTSLQNELKALQKKLQTTIIFVTHDLHEAIKLGSRIILINEGSILQDGPGKELQFNPSSEYVKNFFGVKGFKNYLDDQVLLELYHKIVHKEYTLDQVHENLKL